VFGQFINEKENCSQVLYLVTQELSVSVHTMRSIQFHAIKNAQLFQERWIVPATNCQLVGIQQSFIYIDHYLGATIIFLQLCIINYPV